MEKIIKILKKIRALSKTCVFLKSSKLNFFLLYNLVLFNKNSKLII